MPPTPCPILYMGPIWALMRPYGPLWAHMGPYGPILVRKAGPAFRINLLFDLQN